MTKATKSVIRETDLIRLCEFTRRLRALHREGGDESIDREFNAVCRSIWGYTLDDFDDGDLAGEDLAWLDALTKKRAAAFAIRQGYDLTDHPDDGPVADWWGFVWMILAEARGVLTPEHRAAAWQRHDARMMARKNVVGVIRGQR